MFLSFTSGINEPIVEDISRKNNEPEWMLKKRLDALSYYKMLEEPKFKYGIGITAKQNPMVVNSISKSKKNVHSKNKNVIIEDFSTALKNNEALLKENFMSKCLNPSEDKYVALHNALLSNGTLIVIPKGVNENETITINLYNSQESEFNSILIIAEKDSKATIVLQKLSNENNLFTSDTLEIIANESSTLNIIQIQDLNIKTSNLSNIKAVLDNNAILNFIDAGLGSKFLKSKNTTILRGTGSEYNNYSLNFSSLNQCYDLNSSAIHKSPSTKSKIISTNIVDDNSKLIFNGLIKIEKDAANSQAYQKEENLLLNPNAEVCPIPNLEIDNYDVKCSHAATTTNIDEEKIFYLMSRGLSEEQAIKSVTKGFFNKFLDIIKERPILEIINNAIYKKSKYEYLS